MGILLLARQDRVDLNQDEMNDKNEEITENKKETPKYSRISSQSDKKGIKNNVEVKQVTKQTVIVKAEITNQMEEVSIRGKRSSDKAILEVVTEKTTELQNIMTDIHTDHNTTF